MPLCVNTFLADTAWRLVVLTFDAAAKQTSLHVVGPQAVFSDTASTGGVVPTDAVLGSLHSNTTLDDVRLYDRVLDGIEMQQLYHEHGYNL